MLESLSIRRLGLIDAADVQLSSGLVVVTGETGAGKTLLLDAVRVAAGAKPPTVNQQGDTTVDIELRVQRDAVAAMLETVDAAIEDEICLISRLFPENSRAKSLAGGRVVPSSFLAELAATWLALHGQHDSHRLLKPSTHRDFVDRFGGSALTEAMDRHREAFRSWQQLRDELTRTSAEREALLASAEVIKADVNLIDSLALKPGEDAEIAETIDRLSRVEHVRTAVELAAAALNHEEMSVASALQAAKRALLQGLPDDSQAIDLAGRLESIRTEIADIESGIQAIASGLDIDPVELDALMLRQRQIKTLMLRHGPTLEDVMSWHQQAKRQLDLIDPDGTALAELATQTEAAHRQAMHTAGLLTEQRIRSAQEISVRVTEEVQGLALSHARFEVAIAASEISESGADRVEFMFTANPGIAPAPLAQAASGGELSRLMLAIEVVLADEQSPSVMVFDEVDAGVAGAAAISVAQRLARLARNCQVLVVSHLPQIAAFADQHLVVSKSSDGHVTSTEISEVSGRSRTAEIARMLAGLGDSDTANAHAEELIALAATTKGKS